MTQAPTIKAIPTTYQGTTFRSRTEARWAVFFDKLGIKWQYEAEGYDLGSHGYYLPDFWLPEVRGQYDPVPGVFWEIKGTGAFDDDKMHALARLTGRWVYVAIGSPWDRYGPDVRDNDTAEVFFPDEGWDCAHLFCQCSVCKTWGVAFEGRIGRISCECKIERREGETWNDQPAINAARDAQKHRFWDPPRRHVEFVNGQAVQR